MTTAHISESKAQGSTPPKSMIALNVGLLASCVTALIYFRGHAFIDGISRVNDGHIYVSISNWDIPVFISIPCFLSIIAILILRLVGRGAESTVQKLLKFSFVAALIAIVVRLPIGYLNSTYMYSAGYSPCWELSSPSLMAPTVWVSNSGYCLPEAAGVRGEVLEWIDAQFRSGVRPTPREVAREVSKLR